MRSMVAVAVVGLMGCGGGMVDPEFAGAWTGPELVSVSESLVKQDNAGTLSVAVDGSTGTVSGFCPDGSGSLSVVDGGTVGGLKAYAESFETVSCPAAALGDCPAAVLTFAESAISLFPDGKIFARFEGTRTGCGLATSARVLFTGQK